MIKNETYESPALEVLELEIENAILTVSGENSYPGFGE